MIFNYMDKKVIQQPGNYYAMNMAIRGFPKEIQLGKIYQKYY